MPWAGPLDFGIHSGAGEMELIQLTPRLVKICSSKFVGELVKRRRYPVLN